MLVIKYDKKKVAMAFWSDLHLSCVYVYVDKCLMFYMRLDLCLADI